MLYVIMNHITNKKITKKRKKKTLVTRVPCQCVYIYFFVYGSNTAYVCKHKNKCNIYMEDIKNK